MKRFISFLFIMILAFTVLPVLAGAPTEYEIPDVGTEINGFVVTDLSYMETTATYVVKLEHQKTGAILYWLANDNIDRSYMMAFHTPIFENTGIAHVFEHATLGGSNKYPGANTFSELTSKTSSTFLNAMTGQYYTMYPMASTSEEQLLKYVDYYMNGLTEPLAISNKYAMMREAYRYELDDPDGEISLQGVVYSEMLGALTQQRWANYNYKRMIWPGSYVTYVSGGDPAYIPDLTLETIRDFHATYYHPGNAAMFLTGDLYIPDFLELLDSEFLSKFDRAEIEIKDSGYKPLEPGYYEQVFRYPVESGTPTENAAIIYYGMPVDISDINDMIILDYVCYYMNDESSPLRRKVREQLPEALVSVSTAWEPEGKTSLLFTGQTLDESDKDTFKSICDEALAQLLEEGVNEEVLHGILVREQFNQLMALDNSSVYLNKIQQMVIEWTIFGDLDTWKYFEEFESHLSEHVTAEKLNAAARKYFTGLDTAVMAITVPAPGLKEENDAALRAELDAKKAAMTPEEIDTLVAETKAFHAFVEESNQINMPEELNALSVETLPEEFSYKPASETSVNGIRLITSEVESPLIRVSLRVDSSVIPFEDLFDYMEFCSLLQNLGTDLYTREELPAKIAAVSTGMSMSAIATENYDTRGLENYFLISWFALPETLEDSFALVEDILYHTDFSDYDYIRSDAAQRYALNQMYMDSNGLSLALQAAASAWSNIGKYQYYVNTEAFMAYLDKLSKMSDEEMDALVEKFNKIRSMLLNRNNAAVTVMGNYENILRSTVLSFGLVGKFDDARLDHVDYCAMIEDLPLHTALVTGGNVAYNLAAADLEAAGYDKTDGGTQVVMNILNDKLLYPELRVKNSAYGGYAVVSNDYIFLFYSYRDPKVSETYGVYENAGDFLKDLEIDKTELDSYITSVYGDLTKPIGPLSAALLGINDKISGTDSYGLVLKMIRDIKAFKPEDVAKYAGLAEAAGSAAGSRSTAGAKSMIEENAELFDYINYKLLDQEEEPAEAAVPAEEAVMTAAETEEAPVPAEETAAPAEDAAAPAEDAAAPAEETAAPAEDSEEAAAAAEAAAEGAEEAVIPAEGSDEELIALIGSLSAEDIEGMLRNMDDDDLGSLVSYVMDYFTDDEGKMDAEKVFEMAGAFMNRSWSDREIAEAVEELEEAEKGDDDDDETDAEASETGQWLSVLESLFGEIDTENVGNWVEMFLSERSEAAESLLTPEGKLSSLLKGIFGAFVTAAND